MLDAIALVGLMADPARRRVIAARSGLSVAAVGAAVSRLEAAELVLRDDSGKLHLVDEGYLDRAAGEYWRSGGSVPS